MTQLTREEAIRKISNYLLQFVDDEHSMCQVAKQKGIYCLGFGQYSHQDLRERYIHLIKPGRKYSREQLEDLANTWELARQEVHDKRISCDAEQIDGDRCGGWDGFKNDQLIEYCRALLGEEIEITVAPEP